ncbi:NAD(P)-binding protein [Thozetella sp. PMI_491]|nr:NAD(P)-binding protein [Thozetella sp. PMI_491]
MTKKLFITGATGFIGGSVLDELVSTYPELEITALLRTPRPEFTDKYSTVNVVKGTFDDSDIIEKAAQNADIVLHAGDNNHVGCLTAVLSGLSKRTEPSLLIHLTGTSCISDESIQTWDGNSNPRIWNDITDIQEITTLPEDRLQRPADKMVQEANNDLIKTICICPPDIYGQARSVGSHTTYMIPMYVKAVIKHKEAFYLGKGENFRAVTHLDDVVDLFVLVIGKYLDGGDELSYGKEGYYFAVADEVRWKSVAEAVNKIGQEQGWLPSGTPTVSWNKDQVAAVVPDLPRLALYIWGSNSRAESARAKKLGWKPHGPSFWEALPEDCKTAAGSNLS